MPIRASVVRKVAITTLSLLGLATFATAQTETVLYSFSNESTSGVSPVAGLAADSSGALYGTLTYGGPFGGGTVFKLTPPASKEDPWTETTIHSFPDTWDDGTIPADFGHLIFDKEGNLYGTTGSGGETSYGTVFELTPADGSWTETVLFTFNGTDGQTPQTGLTSSGSDYYGTTANGGQYGAGVVFKLSPPTQAGGNWVETVLYSFTGGTDGSDPVSTPVFHSGKLYGTTFAGGNDNQGVVYELSPPKKGSSAWIETVLHSFNGFNDGGNPMGGIILDKTGNVYGTAKLGGLDYGLVFELLPPTWDETVLYNFTDGSDGEFPEAALIFDSKGNVYGTTTGSGNIGENQGSVFELTPPTAPGGPWTETTLHSFTGGSDGGTPEDGLLLRGGLLYGTTYEGEQGTTNAGVAFKLKP